MRTQLWLPSQLPPFSLPSSPGLTASILCKKNDADIENKRVSEIDIEDKEVISIDIERIYPGPGICFPGL